MTYYVYLYVCFKTSSQLSVLYVHNCYYIGSKEMHDGDGDGGCDDVDDDRDK